MASITTERLHETQGEANLITAGVFQATDLAVFPVKPWNERFTQLDDTFSLTHPRLESTASGEQKDILTAQWDQAITNDPQLANFIRAHKKASDIPPQAVKSASLKKVGQPIYLDRGVTTLISRVASDIYVAAKFGNQEEGKEGAGQAVKRVITTKPGAWGRGLQILEVYSDPVSLSRIHEASVTKEITEAKRNADMHGREFTDEEAETIRNRGEFITDTGILAATTQSLDNNLMQEVVENGLYVLGFVDAAEAVESLRYPATNTVK